MATKLGKYMEMKTKRGRTGKPGVETVSAVDDSKPVSLKNRGANSSVDQKFISYYTRQIMDGKEPRLIGVALAHDIMAAAHDMIKRKPYDGGIDDIIEMCMAAGSELAAADEALQ